jgi:hypothetical protein
MEPARLAQGVEGQDRRGFRQAVALQERLAGDLLPPLGHGGLQRHAARGGEFQVAGRRVEKPDLVREPVEERVDPAHPGDAVILEGAAEVGEGARIGDQQVAPPQGPEPQKVHREGEDVVEGQGGQRDFLPLFKAFDQLEGLFHVHDQVAVRQHRALRNAGRATGILEHGDIVRLQMRAVVGDLDMVLRPVRAARGDGVGQPDMRQFDRRDGAVPVFLHQPHDAPRHGRKELRHAGDDDVGDRVAARGDRHLVGEHVDDDERMRLGILELLAHLLGGIERVHVHQHAARLEDGEGGHGEAEAIGHLHRDPVARAEARDLAQVDRQRVRHLVDLREAERPVHPVGQDAGEGGAER